MTDRSLIADPEETDLLTRATETAIGAADLPATEPADPQVIAALAIVDPEETDLLIRATETVIAAADLPAIETADPPAIVILAIVTPIAVTDPVSADAAADPAKARTLAARISAARISAADPDRARAIAALTAHPETDAAARQALAEIRTRAARALAAMQHR